jgi:hypothetical protein
MFEVASCKAAICMFDGAFAIYEYVLGADAASQTYAFCFAGEQSIQKRRNQRNGQRSLQKRTVD